MSYRIQQKAVKRRAITMSRIMLFKEGQYATIELDSGERVMLSVAQSGIALFQVGFLGLFRKRTIAVWNPSQVKEFVYKLGGQSPNMTPFRYSVEKLASMKTIEEIEEFLRLAI
jgi:hypothetical protein